jgi:hypothetical protein
MEDTTAANEVIVADVDGLGRCVVLICQDLQTLPLSGELVRTFQPDWVFAPILDRDAAPTRWAHQRVFELSAIAPTRFLIACCTAYAKRLGHDEEIAFGLAVGPRAAYGTDVALDRSRAVSAVSASSGASVGFATVQWRNGAWDRTSLRVGR